MRVLLGRKKRMDGVSGEALGGLVGESKRGVWRCMTTGRMSHRSGHVNDPHIQCNDWKLNIRKPDP